MDWKKAVNYTIVFLVFLNAILFSLNIFRQRNVTVGQVRQSGLNTLLNKNGISLSCSLPVKYFPMASIYTENYTFDPLKLRGVFFSDSSKVMRTDKDSKIIFTEGSNTLTIDKYDVCYTEKTGKIVENSQEARNEAAVYADKINSLFGKYSYSSTYATKNGIMVNYYEKVNGYSFFNNYFTVSFNKDGSREISFSYRVPVKQNGEKNDVLASDEAVFALINSIKENRKGEKSIIQDVALGYYKKDNTSEEESVQPYYKIVADGNIYYVNACSGRVLDED